MAERPTQRWRLRRWNVTPVGKSRGGRRIRQAKLERSLLRRTIFMDFIIRILFVLLGLLFMGAAFKTKRMRGALSCRETPGTPISPAGRALVFAIGLLLLARGVRDLIIMLLR